MRTDKRLSQKPDKKAPSRIHKRGIVGYSKKSALLEEAITHMNTGKYGRSSAALKELLALDPQNIEARRLFATLHLRLGSLVTARQAFESLANEAVGRQDYWLAESLLREYLAAGPRCVPFLEQLAKVYQEKGDELAAVVELGKAIDILRDDPDPDNPQKAAQLYSKIREVAPASSVAFQLAQLFDVQTGELLAPPVPSATPSEDPQASPESALLPDSGPAQTVVEHPLPDVMPWEMSDEPSAATQTEPDQPVNASGEVPEPATQEMYEATEPPHQEPVLEQTAAEETSFSLLETESSTPEPLPENPFSGMLATDSALMPAPGIPSPMPWEQMADASLQILEPEVPPPAIVIPEPEAPHPMDGASTLESVLASLRTEEKAEPPPTPAEAAPDKGPSSIAAPIEPPVDLIQPGPASLSAPMPWEQISDPAIQISVVEREPEPLFAPEPFLPPAPVEPVMPAVAMETSDLADAQTAETETQAPMDAPSSETDLSAATSAALPSPSSFSWNSVFDKAWKLTAATMAPSPSVPEQKELEVTDELQPVDAQAGPGGASSMEPQVAPPLANEEPPIAAAPPAPVSQIEVSAPPVESFDPTALQAATPVTPEATGHWNTGEVAVQVHRPSKKKKRWDKDEEEATQPPLPAAVEERREWKSLDEPAPAVTPPASPSHDLRPEWMQATESITFARTDPSPPQVGWSDTSTPVSSDAQPAHAAAMSAVDVLFSSKTTSEDFQPHAPLSWSKPRPRLLARVHRVRIGISSFIGSCFSTTRSLTFLAVMITIAAAVVVSAAVGTLAIVWMTMEDPPTQLYQAMTVSPPRIITDAKKNGYFLLLGFDAPEGRDPVQAGYERKAQPERDRAQAQLCLGDEIRMSTGNAGASDAVVKVWTRSGDVLASVRGQGGALKSLASRESTALARYQQWLTMPFDDWGFGQSFSPNCPRVLLAHRLFLLEGFHQDLSTGLDRLEADAQAWRGALGQAKTLPVKMLAAAAMQDDASLAAGLLSRGELDGAAVGRLSKLVRPLDQVELSVRWPMQSQFVSATKSVSSELKDDETHDRPWHASLASAMRLPVQRRANAYAEYYDAANKAVAGGRFTNLPKMSAFVRTPPSGVMDYLVNPVEHIVGIQPLPSWEPFVYEMVELDAKIRLAGLQAWLRRGPQDADVLTRLAKAGQAYYDPFTGLPMLVNQRKGVIYSVGRDGKDQEGDGLRDVTAMIPAVSSSDARRPQASLH